MALDLTKQEATLVLQMFKETDQDDRINLKLFPKPEDVLVWLRLKEKIEIELAALREAVERERGASVPGA